MCLCVFMCVYVCVSVSVCVCVCARISHLIFTRMLLQITVIF